MRYLSILAAVALLLLGSSLHAQTSLPSFYKRVGAYLPRNSVNETSLVVYNNKLISISFWRSSSPPYIQVNDVASGQQIYQGPWDAAFGTAIVANGVIHIFGSQGILGGPNAIVHSSLDPTTFAPTAPDTIYTSSGSIIYNVGVTYNPDSAQYIIMAQPTQATDGPAFFLASSAIGGPYAPIGGTYSYPSGILGPWKINYVSGAYYMPMQATGVVNGATKYWGVWAKSTDLQNWTISPTIWVYPDYPQEGVNNSDTVCAEFNSLTYCTYFDGDQQTWSEVHIGIYYGTFAQLLANFF